MREEFINGGMSAVGIYTLVTSGVNDAHNCTVRPHCTRSLTQFVFPPPLFIVKMLYHYQAFIFALAPVLRGAVLYRVAQNKIPQQTLCNFSATSWPILKIIEAA